MHTEIHKDSRAYFNDNLISLNTDSFIDQFTKIEIRKITLSDKYTFRLIIIRSKEQTKELARYFVFLKSEFKKLTYLEEGVND